MTRYNSTRPNRNNIYNERKVVENTLESVKANNHVKYTVFFMKIN